MYILLQVACTWLLSTAWAERWRSVFQWWTWLHINRRSRNVATLRSSLPSKKRIHSRKPCVAPEFDELTLILWFRVAQNAVSSYADEYPQPGRLYEDRAKSWVETRNSKLAVSGLIYISSGCYIERHGRIDIVATTFDKAGRM